MPSEFSHRGRPDLSVELFAGNSDRLWRCRCHQTFPVGGLENANVTGGIGPLMGEKVIMLNPYASYGPD